VASPLRLKKWAVALVGAAATCALGLSPVPGGTAGAVTFPPPTTSYYERSANVKTLFAQGKLAGKSGAEGIVILDFGRPASNGLSLGTLSYSGAFIPFTSIAAGVESYVRGYYLSAPRYTSLDVAMGTNDSCGTGQPCGTAPACGCPDEPSDFYAWGQQLAWTVLEVGYWSRQLRALGPYTDDVRVVGADDAEPGYDPGYENTYDVLAGYASVVRGTFPAMVDYGSADAYFWDEAQLLQVAYGFPPDVPMPQIYYSWQAQQWGALLNYARAHRGVSMRIFGVLTTGAGTNDPTTAYADMLGALAEVTTQARIPWLSTIHR